MLDIRLLQTLIVLDEERSVTSAARRMGVSQPAMSTTLRRLRDLFQDPLFVRASDGLLPTDTAVDLLKKAREIVRLVDTLEAEKTPFDPKIAEIEIRISASDFALSSILPSLIRKLQNDAPNVRITVAPLVIDTVVDSLENGSLDLTVLPNFLAPDNMQIRRLFEADFIYLMRDGHPLLEEPVTLAALSRCEHLRVAPISVHRANRIEKIFGNAGLNRRVRLTLSNYVSAFEVVRNTDLIMLTPRNIVRELGVGFATCEPPFKLDPIAMSLIWHPRKQNSKSHRWVRDYLAEAVRSAPEAMRPAD